eukprot:jgi/Galph1/274/GphlegSOOS_G5072.1
METSSTDSKFVARRLSFTSSRIRNDEMNISKLPPVEPQFVDNKKDLRYWISWISENINVEDDWEKRVMALRKIRSLLLGGAAGSEIMSEFLKNIRWAIQKNINDRRSIVVRETCETIQFLSLHIDTSTFETLFDHFFDSLCRNCINTIFVISSCSDQCIRQCIMNAPCLLFLHRFIQASQSLHGVLRHKAFEWIALTIQLLSPEHLQMTHRMSRESYLVKLEKAISKGVVDKLQQVRDNARTCEQLLQNIKPPEE